MCTFSDGPGGKESRRRRRPRRLLCFWRPVGLKKKALPATYRQRVRDCVCPVSRLPGSKPVDYKACAGVRQNAYTKLADVGIDHLRLSA